jgi:hypothetical protein
MVAERREQVIAVGIGSTGNGRSLTLNGRRQPSCGDTSRMNREVHVRICERLGVKFPGPTRQFPGPTRQIPRPPRIHDELLKLGFEVAQSSVAKYMVKRRVPASQGWRTFLCNHAPDVAAMDLFVVPTIGFYLFCAFVIVRLDRRDLVWDGRGEAAPRRRPLQTTKLCPSRSRAYLRNRWRMAS